jgi:hypothetical protein
MLQQARGVHCNQQQVEQIRKLYQDMHPLYKALRETDRAEAKQVLHAVLQQQAARSAGTVMVWAQQRPGQLLDKSVALHTMELYSSCWWLGVEILKSIFAKVKTLDSSSTTTGSIITAITEQLEQSGDNGRCFYNQLYL